MSEETISPFKNMTSSVESEIILTQGVQNELAKYRKINTDLQLQINFLKTELSSAKKQINKYELDVRAKNKLEIELTDSKEKIQNLINEREKYKKEISDQKRTIADLNKKLTSHQSLHKQEIEKLTNSKLSLRKKCESLYTELNESKNKLESIQKLNIELLAKQNQYKQKCKNFEKLLNESNLKIMSLNKERSSFLVTNQTLKDELLSLQLEFESFKINQKESHSNNKIIKQDNNDLKRSIEFLQSQIKLQQTELSKYSQEREQLINAIGNFNLILYKTEEQLADKVKENERIKKRSNLSQFVLQDKFDISQIKIPFSNEKLNKQCHEIILMKQYEPIQRVQMIINQTSKLLDNYKSQENVINELEQKITKTKEENNKTKEILNAIISGLKNLSKINLELDNISFCDKDEEFQNFIAKNCSSYIEFNDPEIIPVNILITSSPETRRKVINKLVNDDNDSFCLFTTLFLINQRLNEMNKMLMNSSVKKLEYERIAKQIGAKSIEEIPIIIKNLMNKLKKIKESRIKLRETIYNNPIIKQNENKKVNYFDEILKLKNENEKYRNENNNLQNEIEKLNETITNLKLKNVKQYVINDLQSEVEKLQNNNKKLQNELENTNKTLDNVKSKYFMFQIHSKQNKLNENNLKEQFQQLQNKYENLETESNKTIKYLKRQLKKYINENKNNETIDEIRNNYEKVIDNMNQNSETFKEKIEFLSDSLKNIEQLNEKLKKENELIRNISNENEQKILTLQNVIEREKQKFGEKLAAKQIEIENNQHNKVEIIKEKMLNEMNIWKETIINEIGQYYMFDKNDISDETFKNVINRIKEDIHKLQIFQEKLSLSDPE